VLNRKGVPPVIIIGTHRSGTSMIADMLRNLGLFIGWELDSHNEALFFTTRNEKILNSCNGGWDNPAVIEHLLDHANMRNKLVDILNHDLQSLSILSYLGPKNFFRYKSVYNLDFPWGWKDPRNTVLLPLWLALFPEANIIHIFRNGIDVAQSLSFREKKRIETIIHGEDRLSEKVMRQTILMKNIGLRIYIIHQIRRILENITPLSKYNNYKVHPCLSIEKAFELWCDYVQKALESTKNKGKKILHIKYEEFLSQPEHYLTMLNDFCGLSSSNKVVKTIAGNVNLERKNAFKTNKELTDFYELKKENFWMKKLGYGQL
jgi:hypothetical protein